MRSANDAELTAIEDGLVQSEVVRLWENDSRFTSLSVDEMSARVANYWVRKAGSTLSQAERLDYFFKGLKFVPAPIGGALKNPTLDGFQWLAGKFGADAAHRAAIETAAKSISAMSASIGFADYHAYLKQTNLIPLSIDLYKNTSPKYQPMILNFIFKDLLLNSMTVTNGFVHAQGEAIKGHDDRFSQYDFKFKKFEAENTRLRASFEGMLSNQEGLKQAAAEFSEGKGELAALVNNQLAQFQENQKMTQYVYQHIKNEEIQAKFKNALTEASSAAGLVVDAASFVIGDVLGDRKLAQKVSHVGGSLIGLGVSIASCLAPTPPTVLLCITGISGSFLGLIKGIAGGGPDQMEMMFEMLKDMAKDIKELVKHFKEMDKFLHGMDETMRAKFKETLEYLVYIANQVSQIKTATSAIRESITWMTQEQYTLFKASNEITNLILPVDRLKRSLQTEGALLPGFVEKYIDFIAWPKKLARHPSMTGLHMEGVFSANIRTMVASGRSLEDIIGAFAKFVCAENPVKESTSCLMAASALSNPNAWFMGAHEFVEILTLIHKKPHLLTEFAQRVPRYGDSSRDIIGYCDDIAQIRNGGEQLIAWHEELIANSGLRKKLIHSYRAFLINLIANTKERIQIHAKAPGSWKHTIQGHLDRVNNEKTALANPDNRQLVVPQLRFQVNARQFAFAPAYLQNACFEWMNFYVRAIENYHQNYQGVVEEISHCFEQRIDDLKFGQGISSPLAVVYSSQNEDIEGIAIELQLAEREEPISCILYPNSKNAKENQVYMSSVAYSRSSLGSYEEMKRRNDCRSRQMREDKACIDLLIQFARKYAEEKAKKTRIHPRYYAAEMMGLGEVKVSIKTSTALTRETHFIAEGKSTLLMTETWSTEAPDSQVTNADRILDLNREQNPQSNHPGSAVGLDGKVSSVLAFTQKNNNEPDRHFTDEDLDLQLEKAIKGSLLKKQYQYLDETIPDETVVDAEAYLLHAYLYFTLGSKYSLFSPLTNFTIWTHKKIAEEVSDCKKKLTDGKLCQELVHQLEGSLKTLSDDEIIIDGLLQKTSAEIPADEKIMHGMDAVRHGLVRIKFFEHSDCRLADVNTAEIDVVKSECEKLSVQNSVGGSIAHSMALCETIFGVKSSLVYEEAANHPRTETSVWQPGFFSHFYNWLTGNNECQKIGNAEKPLECRSVK